VPGEDTGRVVEDERLCEVSSRQELETESGFSGERGWQKLVEVHGYAKAIHLRLHFDAIT
jgi:hypothetical protein